MEEQALSVINEAHGTAFRLLRRYADGEQGAYAVADESGAEFVLKLSGDLTAAERLRATAALTERLRGRGYPAPRYALVGAAEQFVYSIQTAMPGQPIRALGPQHLADVLALNALQAGQAPPGPRTWPAAVAAPTLEGGPGFCLLEPMRDYSPESAALLERLQVIARRGAALALPQDDVVHFDFTPLNLLSEGAGISGVVDWDGAGAGDRAFDLATLLFYSHRDQAVADALYEAARAIAGPEAIALYVAHLAHRMVDWTIRHYDDAAVAYWLGLAQRQLDRYGGAAA